MEADQYAKLHFVCVCCLHSIKKGTKSEQNSKKRRYQFRFFLFLSLFLSNLAPLVISFVLFACVGHFGGARTRWYWYSDCGGNNYMIEVLLHTQARTHTHWLTNTYTHTLWCGAGGGCVGIAAAIALSDRTEHVSLASSSSNSDSSSTPTPASAFRACDHCMPGSCVCECVQVCVFVYSCTYVCVCICVCKRRQWNEWRLCILNSCFVVLVFVVVARFLFLLSFVFL